MKQVDERIRRVSFMDYDLGYFDDETCRLEPIKNPFGPNLLPMCSEQTFHRSSQRTRSMPLCRRDEQSLRSGRLP